MQMAGRGDDLWKPFKVNKLSNTFHLRAAMCDTSMIPIRHIFNAILQAMEYRKKLWGYIRRFMHLICWIHTGFEGFNYLYKQTNDMSQWATLFFPFRFRLRPPVTSCAVGLVRSGSLLLGLGLFARHQVETVLLGDTAVANWVTQQAKYHYNLSQSGYGKGLETACWWVVNRSVLCVCTLHTAGSKSLKAQVNMIPDYISKTIRLTRVDITN